VTLDITSVGSAVASIKAAADIGRAALTLAKDEEVRAKVIDLQEHILAAQGKALEAENEQLNLLRKVADLERELERMRLWDEDKARYELRQVAPDVFVRAVREDKRDGEPEHWLCCNCFDKGEKSILQLNYSSDSRKVYVCHRCDKKIRLPILMPQSHDPQRLLPRDL